MKKVIILFIIAAFLGVGIVAGVNTAQKPNKAILSNLKYKGYISVVYIQKGDTLSMEGISQVQYDSLKTVLK